MDTMYMRFEAVSDSACISLYSDLVLVLQPLSLQILCETADLTERVLQSLI